MQALAWLRTCAEDALMCGIFGWILPSARRKDPALLRRLCGQMEHRGPDGYGEHVADQGGWQVALGHRRLSIIDLSTGDQPMTSADGKLTVVFNGEIYNYVELREELAKSGHTFHTTSDTEVLLEAFRAWGTAALKRLRGMFAFALWNSVDRTLLLVRDPAGKKPLFIARVDDGLVFSSEIGPLLQFPGVGRSFNHKALHAYILNRYVPGPQTFFTEIEKLPPGHYGMWDQNGFRASRYFVPPLATVQPDIDSLPDAVAQFRTIFEEAVKIRMRSDAPYGAYLSGGLDSTSVVAVMAKNCSQPVRTFSVGYSEKRYSELSYARSAARHFNTDHHELVVTPEMFVEAWPDAIRYRGAPVSEASDIPILLLSKAASDHVKMVLTGEGADELFGGYPKHRAEQWVTRYQAVCPRGLHRSIVGPLARVLPYNWRRLKVAVQAAGERDLEKRMQLWFGGTTDEQRLELIGDRFDGQAVDRFPFSLNGTTVLRRTLFFDQTSWLPDNLLERGDRMMMAGSIEGRMPFMDTELATFAAHLPDRLLIGGKGGKTLLREAMQEDVPAGILTRKKVGFRVPIDEWLKGPCRDLLRDCLTSQHSATARLCNRPALRTMVADHLESRQNNDRVLWSLMNLELFLRAFRPDGVGEVR